MAIQFNCPYCTATVQVPDSAAGKNGRCPKCDTWVRIPEVPVPKKAESPLELELEDTAPYVPRVPQTIPDLTDPVANLPSITAGESTGAAQRYLKNRKKRQAFKISQLVVPVGMIVILLAAVWGYVKFQAPSYEGNLAGSRLSPQTSFESQLTPVGTNISTADWQAFLDALREAPVDLRSNLLTVRFTATDKSIQVFLHPGIEADFVQVPVFDQKAVEAAVRKKSAALETARQDEIKLALEEFIRGYKAKTEQATLLLRDYRDELALNSHRLGLGRRCEAVVNNVRYPCIHEEADGRLTFIVPLGTTRFRVQERDDLSEKSIFTSPLNLNVTVTQPLSKPDETFFEPEPGQSGKIPVESPEAPGTSDPVPNALNPEP